MCGFFGGGSVGSGDSFVNDGAKRSRAGASFIQKGVEISGSEFAHKVRESVFDVLLISTEKPANVMGE